jgi:hypothetical protein
MERIQDGGVLLNSWVIPVFESIANSGLQHGFRR